MLGRGLESLIPNNTGNREQNGTPQNGAPREPIQPIPHYTAPQSVPVPPPSPHDEVWPHHEPVRPIHTEPVRPSPHEVRESVFLIEVEKIKPNPYQPRHEFDEEALQELAQSIREFGIIQPISVSKVMKEAETGADVEYQLIAGERRLRAAKIAGLERVPAIVKQMDTGRIKLEVALIENIQRSNLNPLESAKAYARLQDEFGLTQREIAARVGKSREAVANTLRLLSLPSQIQDAIAQSKLSESQGRALLAMQDPNEQIRMFEELMRKKTSVREMKEKSVEREDPRQKYWENQLEEKIGAPVKIRKQGAGGTIGIHYYSNEELQGILERLVGNE